MKAGIHPSYEEVNVICACGSHFPTRSTHKGDLRVEICSSCHPFFTGRQKLVDTEGRVDRFQKKFAKSRELQAQKKIGAQSEDRKKSPVASRTCTSFFGPRSLRGPAPPLLLRRY